MDSRVERLREKGLKVTPQRVAIYGMLLNTVQHPTAENIWEEIKKEYSAVSFNTVYTTLNALVEAGLVQKLHVGSVAHYDATVDPHIHLHCLSCGQVADSTAKISGELLDVSHRALHEGGFQTEKVELTLYGRCHECAARDNNNRKQLH